MRIMERGRRDNLFWTSCECGYEGPAYTTREEAIIMHNDQCMLIAQHLAPRADLNRVTAERDAAVAELEAVKRRIAEAPRETKWFPERMQRGTFALLLEDAK
jgi:hypothetical protein